MNKVLCIHYSYCYVCEYINYVYKATLELFIRIVHSINFNDAVYIYAFTK